MAVIDTITVNSQFLTNGFEQGFGKAKGLVNSFASSIAGPLAGIGTAFAAAFSARKLFDFVKGGLDAADQLDDLATELGTTAEALNQLQHAAVMSDVSVERLIGGLERMQRTLGDAFAGNKAAIEAFKNLHIPLRDLKSLRPEDQFKLIAEMISRIDDPAKRAAAAVDIFGKSGQKLIPLLLEGGDRIDALGQEVAGAFSGENLERIRAADSAMKQLGESVRMLQHEAAIRFAPAAAAGARQAADVLRNPRRELSMPPWMSLAFRRGVADAGADFQSMLPAIIRGFKDEFKEGLPELRKISFGLDQLINVITATANGPPAELK